MSEISLLGRIGNWEQQRWPWIVIAILSAGLVLIAHNVFQVWLYMKPCEQCVYIRFAFLCMTFGCLFPIVCPKSLICRLISYVCGVYGCIYGIMCSVKLQSIHAAIHSDDLDAMFGMQGCSLQPHYPFGLPLEKWAPDWFLPCPPATAATTTPTCRSAPCSRRCRSRSSTCTTMRAAGISFRR